MFGYKTKIKNLEARIAELEEELETEQRHKEGEEVLKEQTDRNAKFLIDWSKIDVFSIERQYNYKGDSSVTLIGYWALINGIKTCKEWVLYCSIERHNELVEEYKAFKGKKK